MQSDKDIGIVVAAHAPLATALVRTVTTIVPNAQLLAVDLVPSQDADGALSLMDEAVKAADLGNGVLVLADLFGGTAANLALSQLGDGKVEVLTGANLAMVLDAVTHASSAVSAGKLALRAAKAAESSVVVASALLTPSSDEIQAA
ncbi:MAG: PTS fructose transporter subunit IIA [Deltaproteobacteria bacterium]|nr:PTS fructose transporter subunit IIA [Deltaproteobacteria bacterium]